LAAVGDAITGGDLYGVRLSVQSSVLSFVVMSAFLVREQILDYLYIEARAKSSVTWGNVII
jgi:hypothetical protein